MALKPAARLSLTRTAILIVVVLIAVFAFTPAAGPFRLLFRLLLIAGVVVLAGSYVWPWLQRFGERRR